MEDRLSGKPGDFSVGEELSAFGNPSEMEYFATAYISTCSKKQQPYSVYARLENPYLLGHGLGGPGASYEESTGVVA